MQKSRSVYLIFVFMEGFIIQLINFNWFTNYNKSQKIRHKVKKQQCRDVRSALMKDHGQQARAMKILLGL